MSVFAGPEIVNNGLVLALDAGNSKSYPGSGTTWFDLSGNGNHSSIVSGEFVSNGSYLRNSGNVSNTFYIAVPHSTSLNNTLTVTTGGWTIEEIIWTNSVTYPESDAGAAASGAAYGTGATGFDWNHGVSNSVFNFGQSSNSATAGYEDTASFGVTSPYDSLNAWRVRTMIWNRSTNTNSLYINGAFINSISTPNTAGTSIYDGSGIVFGTLYGWNHFGRRAAIKIYNTVLSAVEISQNFNALRGRFGI